MRWLVPGLLAVLLGAGGSYPEGVESPHGKADACTACHLEGTAEEPGPPRPIVETCRSCHPDADMHPVGMAPQDVKVAEGWPLEDGKMVCATCHVEPAHDPDAAAAQVSPWFRGGPYPRQGDMCFSCHQRTTLERTDPHHPATVRDPSDPSCSACHTGRPEEGAAVAESRLRLGEDAVCATCHEGLVHHGTQAHLGKQVAADRRASLQPALTLDSQGRVQCFTCHDVHEDAGSAALPRKGARLRDDLRSAAMGGEWSGLDDPDLRWPGADRGAHPSLLALPLDELCSACHGTGGR